MGRKILQTILLLISAFPFGWSQKLDFEHLTDKDGLVNSSVNTIIKDSYGYMWIGTFNGLSRYDGYKFTNYINDADNNLSLNDNYISCFFESRDSTFFIGFQYSGFCIYNRAANNFIRFRHDPKNSNSLSNDYVLAIGGDRNGNIWIGTRGGLDRFDPQKKSFIHYQLKKNENFFVSSIIEDKEGNLWLYGRGNEVCKFNYLKNTREFIAYGNESKVNRSFNRGGALKIDSRGNLWVASPGDGLFKYDLKTGYKESYTAENKKIPSNIIFSIIEDSEGKIWIGTDGEGVCKYDHLKNSFEIFRHDPYDLASLNSNAIYCIYEGRPGEIWIGAYASGLNIYKKGQQKFFKYSSRGKPGHCLSHKSVLSIAEAEDGKIWLGTDRGGLDLFDPVKGTFTYFTTDNSIIHSNIIKSICVDKDNNLWLGSYGEGLSRLNFKTGKVTVYRGNLKAKGETILHEHVWDIEESFDHKIWIGLLDYGVNVYDPNSNRFSYYSFDSSAFDKATSNIFKMLEDSKHRMWIGTETEGLGYFDPDKKIFKRFKYEQGLHGTIGSNNIHEIFEDSQGNIWIGTFKGGLNRLVDIQKGIFEKYTTKDGLPTDNIQDILEDDHHNLWISTDKGITLFKVKERKFINFDIEDGLQSNEFNFNAALKAKNGYMYFGGIQGLNFFHPDSIVFNSNPPIVTLTDFKIFNKSIKPGTTYNQRVYLTKSIDMTKEITLTHDDYIFSLAFAALDFTSPKKNKYAYRLQGFSNQWTHVNADQRFATYTNLDPGEYIFQVIASNNDGVWNSKGISIKIIVLPPWWMTWWFRLITTLAIVLLIVAFYYIRMKAIRRRNQYLEKEVKKRTQEILSQQEEIIRQKDQLETKKQELEYLNKTKDKFFSIIGHDLKGPVKALTSLTSLLKEESSSMTSDKQRMLTNHIDTSSQKIQKLVLNLLEWARAQSGQVKIEKEVFPVSKLFKDNVELLSEQASQKQIEIKIQAEQDLLVYGDYNMISTIVRNVLSNSIKYTSRGGSITLSSSLNKEKEIKLSVADEGIGMSEEVLSKLFSIEKSGSVKGTDNELGTGLGMIIAKEFTEMNNGKIYAESILGKGSTFYLILPNSNSLS